MKRTELERIEREVRRTEKKKDLILNRKDTSGSTNIGMYIDQLFERFLYDEDEIFNTQKDISILEILENMQQNVPSKKWDDILKKAIKKAGVKKREKALTELKELITS